MALGLRLESIRLTALINQGRRLWCWFVSWIKACAAGRVGLVWGFGANPRRFGGINARLLGSGVFPAGDSRRRPLFRRP